MIAAGADATAQGVILVRRQIDWVVGHGGEGGLGVTAGFSQGPMRLGQDLRDDAVADRRLVVPALLMVGGL